MIASTAKQDAYGSVRSKRDIESSIILETTRRLKNASFRRKDDFPGFLAALHDNFRLWNILASDVASKGNSLPPDLKSKIFYLGEFVRHYTKSVQSNDESCQPLIDINLAVYRGLTSNGKP